MVSKVTARQQGLTMGNLLVIGFMFSTINNCWAFSDVSLGNEAQSIRRKVDEAAQHHARSLQQFLHCTYTGFCNHNDPAGAKNICCTVAAFDDGSCVAAGSFFWVPTCAWFNAGPQVKSCCF